MVQVTIAPDAKLRQSSGRSPIGELGLQFTCLVIPCCEIEQYSGKLSLCMSGGRQCHEAPAYRSIASLKLRQKLWLCMAWVNVSAWRHCAGGLETDGPFVQGLLLPLCQSGTCTLREAVIFTAMLKRTSIPALHSAAALLRIADMPYSGTNSFFIRVLLDKKYALPYRVVRALLQATLQPHLCPPM